MQLKEKIIAQIEEQLPMLPEEDILFLADVLNIEETLQRENVKLEQEVKEKRQQSA